MIVFHLSFFLTSALGFNWTPNTQECLQAYNSCLSSAGRDCRESLDLCNAKAYGPDNQWAQKEKAAEPSPAAAPAQDEEKKTQEDYH